MLPIVDKPLIQYAAEEALAAGADKLVFITGTSKRAIEDHFDTDHELEKELEAQGKQELLDAVRGIVPAHASCIYIRQPAPLGLGHAVLCAKPVVGDEPFFVHLADDLIDAETPCLKQMVEVWNEAGGNLVASMDVPRDQTSRYGILDVVSEKGKLAKAKGLVEKPKPAEAPSTLSIIGRYILQPEVMRELGSQEKGAGGEIQLTDAMARTLDRVDFHGYRFDGVRYDCGSKSGFVEATLAFAKEHEEIQDDLPGIIQRVTGAGQ
jgi:UTP--glucose-1-phosphate uridylyltransferase